MISVKDQNKDIDLLLIGKTGNGKSALGNTILDRCIFQSVSSQESVTVDTQSEVSDYQGRTILVVDGPGVGDTRMDNESARNLVINAMRAAFAANPRGYHAFLLVHKYGTRFTAEDKDTVTFLKEIFGKDFVKDFCILVLTYGDCFESEDDESTFQDWCQRQKGVFKDLMEECSNRVVLMDNRTNDEKKKQVQLEELINTVDNLRWRDKRYTNEEFREARKLREKYIVESHLPIIKERTLDELKLIMCKFEIQKDNSTLVTKQEWEKLYQRTKELRQSVTDEDRGTGVLRDVTQTVESMIRAIDDEIKIFDKMSAARDKIKKKEEEQRKLYEKTAKRHSNLLLQRMQQSQLDEVRKVELQREMEGREQELEAKLHAKSSKKEEKLLRLVEKQRIKQQNKLEEINLKYNAILKVTRKI